MIARLWHGAVPSQRVRRVPAVPRKDRNPRFPRDARKPGGLRPAPRRRGAAHFLFVSLWESFDAISAFAGADVEKARYYPEDRDYLLELEPTVTHYEVVAKP